MSQPILAILKDTDLQSIHEDSLGKQAVRLDLNYPGQHAADSGDRMPTKLTLQQCDATDSQQLWGGH